MNIKKSRLSLSIRLKNELNYFKPLLNRNFQIHSLIWRKNTQNSKKEIL